MDVNRSDWDCTLEGQGPAQGSVEPALRLGFRLLGGVPRGAIEQLVAAPAARRLVVGRFHADADLSAAVLERLAEADVFGCPGNSIDGRHCGNRWPSTAR